MQRVVRVLHALGVSTGLAAQTSNIRRVCKLLICATSIFAHTVSAADNLTFFKNYFVTGDYVVAGVGMKGSGVGGVATKNISMNGVPASADPVAAFLYWEGVESQDGQTAKGKFRGYDIVGKPLGNRVGPCWSSGGATGASNGGPQLRVYRADVLRYLPAQNGKRIANGSFAVSLPDSGSGNQTPFSVGASLLIIYRDPTMPLRAVVIYDGAYTMNQSTGTFTQTIQGFYQTSSTNPAAKLTHIVGNAQAKFGERLLFNGSVLNATNPFVGAEGASWDDATIAVTVPGNSASATTSVDHNGMSSFNCLSWGAVVFSTAVQDTDGDGLLDTWELNGLRDIADPTLTLLNLPAMGADPNVKDLFVEIDYMTPADHSHTHKPKQAALDMVADAFRNAPGGPVNVHFDVAATLQDGADIPETTTALYPGYSGVVGWKSGFRAIKDQYFAHNRRDIFHYVLFAHALGLPEMPLANPPVLRTTSGIADLPGGDVLITLGLWRSDNPADDQVGSVLQQAGTLMHELGHNQYLRHGGDENTPGCKPNYQSVMNYLFQVRGLQTAAGNLLVDYSRQSLPTLDEANLNEASGLGTMAYRDRWYAGPNFLDIRLNNTLGGRLATHHCDGTPLNPLENPLVRVESPGVTGYLDWNNDGKLTAGLVALDINFSGSTNLPMTGFNDWTAVDLRQIGSRRNAKGLSGDIASGDIASGDIASGDIASGDIASGDIASGDIASGDIASGIANQLDVDYETASSVVDAPNSLTGTAVQRGIVLNWTVSGFGLVRKYGVYRAENAITPSNLPALIGTVSGTPPPTTFTDGNVTKKVNYYYFVTAINDKGVQSGASIIIGPVTVK